jgi:hypothetical protein
MTARAIKKSGSFLVVVATSLFSPVACSSTSDRCTTNAGCPGDRPCDANGGCQDTGAEGSASASDGGAERSDAGGEETSGGTCSGFGECGFPPHCALGCYLRVGPNPVDPSVDTCGGTPDPCDQFYGLSLCETLGCQWTGPGSE